MLARFILWRLIGLAAAILVVSMGSWLLGGGAVRVLRGASGDGPWLPLEKISKHLWSLGAVAGLPLVGALACCGFAALAAAGAMRFEARRKRRYVRLRVLPYRTDESTAEGVVALFESLHKRMLRRWWRRLLLGQASVSLEVHREVAGAGRGATFGQVSLAVSCPAGAESMIETALRSAYPNCSLQTTNLPLGSPPVLLRLEKRAEFIKRVKVLDRYEHERSPAMNRLMTVIGTCSGPAYVQLALTPAPAAFERYAEAAYKHYERRKRWRLESLRPVPHQSFYDEVELKGGLWLQHRPLFFVDLRVVAPDRAQAQRIASELRAQGAENRLIERSSGVRQGLLRVYDRRLARGEGNPLVPLRKGVFAPSELAALWHLPSVDYANVPFARASVPTAPAPPAICRPTEGTGMLRDALGPVSIHEQSRRGNVAVPGAVEQGKSSCLVASVAEDLRRARCAVILLDPKGDAAEAAVSAVPQERTCTLLDFSSPTCGFNPLAAKAAPDVVADYVVAALRNLFTDADIRASSDRYLRNAIIAVLGHDPRATLWDAARLLSVGEEGYAYRARVGAHVRAMPELKEISQFFTAELSAQLADARSTTTAKLDAPVNKLARLLNSASIKRILLNEHLTVDFDGVISRCEVLVVKGALGTMGPGNTSVLMQMLIGMLDAALARQQDEVVPERRVAVALKIDEAPLVINKGFAETMALKRSAGLETMACWQTDAQWVDREIREQLDALFAHRIYFATASVPDARAAASLMMAEFSDSVRPGIRNLSVLGRPDARLHLPKHHAIVSFSTPQGRQSPFLARTIPMRADPERVVLHAARQSKRGGRYLTDLRQPHWDRSPAVRPPASAPPEPPGRRERVARDAGDTSPAQPAPAPTAVARARASASSYSELVDLDGAHRLRVVEHAVLSRAPGLDPLDKEVLALVAELRYVLSTQIHRRFNAGRARTTTQRRLKRLADSGLLGRLQFHRRDGAGIPICYAITKAGLETLRDFDPDGLSTRGSCQLSAPPIPSSRGEHRAVSQVRHELHVTGWVLALERAVSAGMLRLRGPADSVISPPVRAAPTGRVAIGPTDLKLPGGRTPHDFWRTDPSGERTEVGRFETVRPDAAVELPARGAQPAAPSPNVRRGQADTSRTEAAGEASPRRLDLLVERDDRVPIGSRGAKLERYDHLIAGWVEHTRRYGSRQVARPLVVFVCRDHSRARECARHADTVLTACRAYPGEYPSEWEYPGRQRIFFAAERDVHEGMTRGYGVQPLPPEVRASLAHGDPRARVAEPELHDLLRRGPWT